MAALRGAVDTDYLKTFFEKATLLLLSATCKAVRQTLASDIAHEAQDRQLAAVNQLIQAEVQDVDESEDESVSPIASPARPLYCPWFDSDSD